MNKLIVTTIAAAFILGFSPLTSAAETLATANNGVSYTTGTDRGGSPDGTLGTDRGGRPEGSNTVECEHGCIWESVLALLESVVSAR